MGKIESIRLAGTAAFDRGPAIGALSRHTPDLLDVLAGGEPPAFATDSRERVVFWNRGAAALIGRRADEAMGRHCYEVLGGRDVFGNRFCYANCPIAAMSRREEAPCPFEVRLPRGDGGDLQTVHVTVVRVPGPLEDLFTLVHILHPVDERTRLAHVLADLAPQAAALVPPGGPVAARASLEAPGRGPAMLTPREREVLGWVAAGLQNKEIAQKLDLSLATVRNHIHNTLEKLEVHSKLEAVSLAFRNGWVQRESAASKP